MIEKAKWSEYVTEYEQVDEAKRIYLMEQMIDQYGSNETKTVEAYRIASLEKVSKLAKEIKYPVTEKIRIEEMPSTLNTTIIKIEDLLEEDLTNEEKVNLYKVDFSKIDVDVKREYTINIVTGMLYSIDSQVYRGNTYHTPRLGVTRNDEVDEEESELINEPGTYKMTVDAGEIAQWLGIEVRNLVIPEGAKVEYSFETSDDRIDYDKEVNNIEDTRNSQYLRVKITLIPNEKGECPSLRSVRVRFRAVDEIKIEEPSLENMKPVEEMGQTLWQLEEGKETGKIQQVIDFGEDYQNTNNDSTKIEVPIIKSNGKIEYLSSTNHSISGATLNIYVSKDGENWTKIDPTKDTTAGHRYVKVETVVTDNSIKIGKVQINKKEKPAEEEEWITYQTEYYETDAIQQGEWIRIETEEEIAEGTRIVYSFSKSNDDVNYTNYSNDITVNGNSRYLTVRVEYQRQKGKEENKAILNDIMIIYKINGVTNYKSMDGEGLVQVIRKANIENEGYYKINIEDQSYTIHTYVYEGNQVWDSMTFGDSNDVGASGKYAQNMVVVKVKGDLTINEGATITAYNTSYGGPKGMLLCVTGKLTNNGTISMTARGAYAEGQDVYLFRNSNKSYEYVPAIGGSGAAGVSGDTIAGRTGGDGENRQTRWRSIRRIL